MAKAPRARLLDVGNCDPDHGMIRAMLEEHFDVEIDRVMFVDEAIAMMKETTYGLVLFNRLTFADGSEAIEILRRAKGDPGLQSVPIMMISNYPEAQAASMELGGEKGFGKKDLRADRTVELLSKYLPRRSITSQSRQVARGRSRD